MVFLDVHFTCFHLLTYYSAHWLLWELHTANDGLEALVGKGWLVAIQLNYSGDKINKVKQHSLTTTDDRMTSKLDPAISAQDSLSLCIQKSLQTYVPLGASLKQILKSTKQNSKIHKTKHHILPHICRGKKPQKLKTAPAESS